MRMTYSRGSSYDPNDTSGDSRTDRKLDSNSSAGTSGDSEFANEKNESWSPIPPANPLGALYRSSAPIELSASLLLAALRASSSSRCPCSRSKSSFSRLDKSCTRDGGDGVWAKSVVRGHGESRLSEQLRLIRSSICGCSSFTWELAVFRAGVLNRKSSSSSTVVSSLM